VQQPEKSAAETEPQRRRTLRLEKERGIVQPQLLQGIAQNRVLVGVDGVYAGKDHGLDVFEARQRLDCGTLFVGNRVADLGVGDSLDVRDDESDLTRFEPIDGHRFGRQHAEGLHLEHFSVRPEPNLLSQFQRSLHHAGQHDDAAIRVEPRIEDQGLQVVLRLTFRRWNPFDDRLQHLWNAGAGLRAYGQGVGRIQTYRAFDHFFRANDIGARQVDLVDDGHDFQAVIDRQVGVGERLGFHALRSVHHEKRAFAGSQRTRDFIGEVHVTGRVDQVQLVHLAVVRLIVHPHAMGFDGDAALPLQVHGIEHLLLHFTGRQGPGKLQQTV